MHSAIIGWTTLLANPPAIPSMSGYTEPCPSLIGSSDWKLISGVSPQGIVSNTTAQSSREQNIINPAYPVKTYESIIANALYHHPDLIGMCGHHQYRPICATSFYGAKLPQLSTSTESAIGVKASLKYLTTLCSSPDSPHRDVKSLSLFLSLSFTVISP